VARFLGFNNLLKGTAFQNGKKTLAETAIGTIPVQTSNHGAVTVLLRPDTLRLDGSGSFQLSGFLREITFQGASSKIIIEINGILLTFHLLPSSPLPKVGEMIAISVNPEEAFQVLPG
jgi:ABC-type Fe3+/spermidine/putrescine transport system ATPase subunit